MKYDQIVFSGHAIARMFKRRISQNEVKSVVRDGKVIARYTDDNLFPSLLMLGFPQERRPLHIVIAIDSETSTIFVITAYEPDSRLIQAFGEAFQ